MSLLRMLGISNQKKTAGASRAKMPTLHSFVSVVKSGSVGAIQVSVEEIGPKSMTTTDGGIGKTPGTPVVFTYANPAGKFRFRTKVIGSRGDMVVFALPDRIETISAQAGGGAQKRSNVRLETTVPGQWRFSRAGKGLGDFAKCSISDISRTGASLIIDRELRKGTQVEVSLALNSGQAPLVLLGEVMRVVAIASSGKHNHGLRFHGMSPQDDKAVMDFINRRQAERRSRGLA